MANTSEKDMYPYVQTNLRARFPKSDGWEIYHQDRRGSQTYIPDFVVEKKTKNITYKIPVEVKCTCKAIQADIDQLNRYSKSLAGPNVSIQSKILVYPSGANTSLVPNDVEIMYLRNFKCE